MRNPNYRGSPPPYRRHTECTRRLNKTARCINRRADIIAEGDTTADLDPDLERTGPVVHLSEGSGRKQTNNQHLMTTVVSGGLPLQFWYQTSNRCVVHAFG